MNQSPHAISLSYNINATKTVGAVLLRCCNSGFSREENDWAWGDLRCNCPLPPDRQVQSPDSLLRNDTFGSAADYVYGL